MNHGKNRNVKSLQGKNHHDQNHRHVDEFGNNRNVKKQRDNYHHEKKQYYGGKKEHDIISTMVRTSSSMEKHRGEN